MSGFFKQPFKKGVTKIIYDTNISVKLRFVNRFFKKNLKIIAHENNIPLYLQCEVTINVCC